MNQRTALGLVALAAAATLPSHVSAQSITGYSAIQEAWDCPVTTVPKPINPTASGNVGTSPDIGRICTPRIGAYNFNAQVYSQTAEDYNSALYYNVQTAAGEYYEGSNNPIASQVTPPTNGTASTQLSYYYPNANVDGIYSETTTHALNFYYVTAGDSTTIHTATAHSPTGRQTEATATGIGSTST